MTINHQPKILFFDVETCPVLAWLWRTGYNINVSHEQLKKGQKFDIICLCYKWLGKKEVHSLDWGLNAQDSSKMIEKFTKVVESADLVLAHNGDRFDIKQINTQRLLHGQGPIAWPTSEDTLKQFRKYFAFPSYKLDYLAKTLTGSGKDKMVFQDWVDIVENKSPEALEKMVRYCRRDVIKLEQLFKQASPHFGVKAHMGMALGKHRGTCPRCASEKLVRDGYITLRAGRYARLKCDSCGHKFRTSLKLS